MKSTNKKNKRLNHFCCFVKLPLLFYNIYLLFLLHVTVAITSAWVKCGNNTVCPDGNTCCMNAIAHGGCISNDMGSSNATCCSDQRTGCPVGYICREDNFGMSQNDCMATADAPMADKFVQKLPRYRLCQVSHEMSQFHGINISAVDKSDIGSSNNDRYHNLNDNPNDNGNRVQLGYYSSHGSVDRITPQDIDMILIVIHGAGRNSDDYFCSALAATKIQQRWKNVWVIAPKFFEDIDKPPKEFLYWDHADGDGTWRYGANSSNGGLTGISSFAAMDQFVSFLWQLIPNLEQMTIAGHSSGGQFVNRWSVMTQQKQASWMTENYGKMKWVVTNPSSYVYLTPLRWIDNEEKWGIPQIDHQPEHQPESNAILSSSNNNGNCPNYNRWEWGLEDGGIYDVPYRKDVIQNKRKSSIIEEFRNRHIVYLTGSVDQCPTRTRQQEPLGLNVANEEKSEMCHSHGIETTCMDELQGRNRLERSFKYMQSLKDVLGGEHLWRNHTHQIVLGVGHDHSLMWTSSIGIQAIFGSIIKVNESELQKNSASSTSSFGTINESDILENSSTSSSSAARTSNENSKTKSNNRSITSSSHIGSRGGRTQDSNSKYATQI